ncbi:hypothetical protein ACJMK2_026695 [Sinanodonta woodiana]|uniref:HECT domain-containing protein n=1 Tax=Sinanodonta woodiana TaxID=1069815 RepID=A0ABD3XNU1_SINWO
MQVTVFVKVRPSVLYNPIYLGGDENGKTQSLVNLSSDLTTNDNSCPFLVCCSGGGCRQCCHSLCRSRCCLAVQGGCRQCCHSFCRSRCCLAVQGGCRSSFVSFRGCLCSMVNCIRPRHRQRWDRIVDETDNVPGIVAEPAREAREPDANQSVSITRTNANQSVSIPRTNANQSVSIPHTNANQSGSIPRTNANQSDSIPRTNANQSDSIPRTNANQSDSIPRTNVNQSGSIPRTNANQSGSILRDMANQSGAIPSQLSQAQDISYISTIIPESGAIGGTWTPANLLEVEMRKQHAIETRLSLNSLHQMLKFPPQMLRVRRNELVKDVLSRFEDPSLGEKLISTRMIDEDGVDLGGVTRDMLTSFWNKVRETYFPGNEAYVPYVGLTSRAKQRDYITLGRIFSHSTATLKSLPIQICRSTLMVIIYDSCDINEDTLLDDFLLYLDCEDSELVRCALYNFVNLGEVGKDKLQMFFSKYGVGINPRAATIKEHLVNLAHNELCIKPRPFCENMRRGIPSTHMDTFWLNITLDNVDHLYEGFRVIPANVWSMIQCQTWPIQNPNERRVFGYLRDLIQDLHGENLLSFLQFVTAERKMPSSVITVGFNDTRGLARRPIASTCSCQLNIPVSYTSFDEFKREFMMVLSSDESRTFNAQ